jgi:hypothetical protein
LNHYNKNANPVPKETVDEILQVVHLFIYLISLKRKIKEIKKPGNKNPIKDQRQLYETIQKNKFSGARGETRTRIGISPLDPKSSASTISATLAQETPK